MIMNETMRPKKSLGQNFLIDPNYKRKIIEAITPSLNDEILEIGPGRGVLTSELVGRCSHLWLIEKDKELARSLSKKYEEEPKLTIITEDFLETDLEDLWGEPPWEIKVIGNLPYNAASQILIRLLKNRFYFSDCYLMFQKEMALRLIGKPGTKDYSLLSLWTQIYTDCKILFHLPPTAFRPRPKVTSSFVHFKLRSHPLLPDKEAPYFWGLMHTLFEQRRKTIRGTLKGKGNVNLKALQKMIPPKARAETFSVEELIALARSLRGISSSS